jgi:predicted nucleotidyltransferase
VPHPAPAPAGGTLARGAEQVLEDLVRASQTAFGRSLVSIVLFGSAAEGQLRPTSDVNVIIVLAAFDRAQVDQIRETLRLAHAAARVSVMFVLQDELPAAADAFAVKFADIGRRRRVLFGADPFAQLAPSRDAQVARLTQVLVNLVLRLRARYALVSLRDEQLKVVIADAAGPLRAAAALLLELEGRQPESPKAALALVARELGTNETVLARMSEARETRALPAGTAGSVVFDLLELAAGMRDRVARLAGHGA